MNAARGRVTQGPPIFRVLIPAQDLPKARGFYESLLETPGRDVAPGRIYFDCGSVILGVLDYSKESGPLPRPAESIYFATDRLERVHELAVRLGSTVKELLHDDPSQPMGEIRVRPWGERSFYAVDPSGNSLCFVDGRTLFTGTPDQVAALNAQARP